MFIAPGSGETRAPEERHVSEVGVRNGTSGPADRIGPFILLGAQLFSARHIALLWSEEKTRQPCALVSFTFRIHLASFIRLVWSA
jgi:hypothetical protein